MKIGFCNKFFTGLKTAFLTDAGFECFSLCLCRNEDKSNAKLAHELCFSGMDESAFYDAARMASENGVRKLVISEDFALEKEEMLLSLPKMSFEIAIENEKADVGSLLEFFEKADESNNAFGLCLNTGHAILSDHEPHELLSVFRRKIFSIHANDNHRTGDYHLPPFRGRGGVDWEEFTAALAETGYDGELYLDVRAPDVSSDIIMKKSLAVLCLIAKDIEESIRKKRGKL